MPAEAPVRAHARGTTWLAQGAALICTLAWACGAQAAGPEVPDAAASDPVKLGWMVGTPPAPDKTLQVRDGTFYRFPQLRWSLSHWRELFPTRNVSRGRVPVAPLPRAPQPADLDAIEFTPLGAEQTMTWKESLADNYTDGVLVLHRGHIVYERYFGALTPETQHVAFSVTKSFMGTLAAMLVAEGKLDPRAKVSRYIPELADSGFGDATVQQVLDMTTALDYSEAYADPNSSFLQYARAAGMLPSLPGEKGPVGVYEYARTLKKSGEHGERFVYRSPNTDVVGWLIARATSKSPDAVLQERIWSRLGAESDAYMALDPAGNATAAGGLNLRLRDLARFGEMIRLEGRYNGQQIVPKSVIDDIRAGGSREAFVYGGYPTLKGWSYRNQWWISHDDHGAFMARGIHGQAIYIDPKAELVIARFASSHKASNLLLDPTSIPAYRAVARHLMRGSR